MRRAFSRLALVLAVLAVVGPSALPTRADQAPFWESPVGLVPGHPTSQVRMAGETVDVQVVERGDEIRAVVAATFTMVNDGADERLTVGFPASTVSLFDALVEPDAEGRRFADAPAMFSPQAIRAFTVSVDGRELRSWRQDVPAAAEAGFGADWLMWEMAFPAAQTVRVDVGYEQVLTSRASDRFVQPMYVLRTGALWHGNIGEATVTLSAPDGGVFIGGPELYSGTAADGSVRTYPRADQVYGPADAVDAVPTRIVWRLRDVEPTRDVGATYVRSSAWRTLAEAERSVLEGGTSSAEQLRAAAVAALDLLGAADPCGEAPPALCFAGPYGLPRGLVDRLAPTARERARRAAQLAPDNAGTLLAYGDLEHWYAMPKGKHHGELGCWPSSAVDAYEKVEALGSADAGPRLTGLRRAAQLGRQWQFHRVETCSGSPDPRLDVELIKATVEFANHAWRRAIAQSGTADEYPFYFGGRWLDERTAEVTDLRRSGRHRRAALESLEVTRADLLDPGAATVETVEVWQDHTYAADGSIVRDASGRLRQRYDLRKLDGLWKIVDASIVRE